jgi:AP-3 complex subunit delta-1
MSVLKCLYISYFSLMCRYLTDPQSTLEAMLRGRVFALPGHIQAVYVQNILKLFAHILTRTEEQQDIERMNKVIMH